MLHSRSLDPIEPGLYVVATPIGNLKDITLRALDVLSAVHLVAAEDTRVTRNLLVHHGINAKIVSLREHNEARQAEQLVAAMESGQSIALVTDAGTPGISDPGAIFVKRARQAGVKVWPVPGACALTCALSALGWEGAGFTFLGFLPSRGAERKRALDKVATQAETIVLYEAPHRIEETLVDLSERLGPERNCAIFRELTKKFEQTMQGTLTEILTWVRGDADHRRGEFVLVLQGLSSDGDEPDTDSDRVLRLLCESLPTRDAVRIAAEITGRKRNELYTLALSLKSENKPMEDADD